MERRALIAMHDLSWRETIEELAQDKGWQIHSVATLDDMLARMDERNYGLYVMDPNLGTYGGRDITPAETVYERVRVQPGVKFLAISGSDRVILACKEKGIPAISKTSGLATINSYI
ncbi:hypothetical protein EXS74_00045 [Candidatus Woesearchaeota archaeon]|nr:hypothetical protein [Candidatus Woesearchaeota archaeon]